MLSDNINKPGLTLMVVGSTCTDRPQHEVSTLRQLAGIMTDVRNVMEQEWQTTQQTRSKPAPAKSR